MTQNLDNKFKEKWSLIEKEFKNIQKEKLLPFTFVNNEGKKETIEEKDISNVLETKKNTKFTISVCGVVKAGKSTFLNSLLFGKDVLPTFDIPLTAKLTFIEYTDKPQNYFVATFYTKSEWDELIKDFRENDSTQLEQLSERITICEKKNVIKESLFGTTKQENNLENLKYYVSDPKTADGIYTPFVKCVNVYINNESIKNIRIVDTPGLNDSNIINSQETIKWIKNTHALIFLLRNKGVDSFDFDFFSAHLSQTTPESRIFVINKIDSISEQDAKSIIAHLRELGRSDKYIQKGNLFCQRETICRYSGLISILQKMYKNGEILNEEQSYYLEKYKNINTDPDNVSEAISNRLYNNAGKIIFDSGVSCISDIYEKMLRQFEYEKIDKEEILKDCDKNKEKLDKEIKELKNLKDKFISKVEEEKGVLKDRVDSEKSNLGKRKIEALNLLENSINWNKYNCAEDLRNQLPYDFQKVFFSEFGKDGKMVELLSNFRRNINDIIKLSQKALQKFCNEVGIEDQIIFKRFNYDIDVSFDQIDLINSFRAALNENVDKWFTRMTTKVNQARSVFMDFRNVIEDETNTIIDDIRAKAEKCIEDNGEFVASRIDALIDNKKSIVEISSEQEKELKENIENEIKEIQKRYNILKDKQTNFKKECEII